MIRIVIVDDHAIVRDGLRAALASRTDLEIVGEAATGNDAVAVTIETNPDVVVMDLGLPDIDGAVATRRIRDSGSAARIVVLTMASDDDSVMRVIRPARTGMSSRTQTVTRSSAPFGPSPPAARRLARPPPTSSSVPCAAPAARRLRRSPSSPHESARCSSCSRKAARTARSREVLYLSPKTVRNRTSVIFAKLGVSDRAAAIILARDAGLGRA